MRKQTPAARALSPRQRTSAGVRYGARLGRLLALLLLPTATAAAQSLHHPLEVACAPGTSPAVRRTAVQLAFEPAGSDTVRSVALLTDVARQWAAPADYALPELAVWAPLGSNDAYSPLSQRVEVVWDGRRSLLEVRQGPSLGHRQTRPALNAALDRAVRLAFVAAAPTAAAQNPTPRTDAVESSSRDSVSFYFTARETAVANAVVVGVQEVAHLVPEEPARLLRFPTPVYPKRMLADGVEGAVDLSYVVRPDSSATAFIVLASPDSSFSTAALQAATRSRSVPGTAGGCRVSSLVRQRVAFRLGE